MISIAKDTFLLSTKNTSLLLSVNQAGKVGTEYFGALLKEGEDVSSFIKKTSYFPGTNVTLDEDKPDICLDYLREDFSLPLKGDFHKPSLLLSNEDTSVFDFRFVSATKREAEEIPFLPTPRGAKEELVLVLKETKMNVNLKLHYLVYEEEDVIGRYVEIVNEEEGAINIHKASSFLLTLPYTNQKLTLFHGGWADEGHKETVPLFHGTFSFGSDTGSSSNRHNPFFILSSEEANLQEGVCYGFNLVYSGSFEAAIELDHFNNVYIQEGISSLFFKKTLSKGESFFTPLAVLSYSEAGFNGLSLNFQHFVKHCVTPKEFEGQLRPVIYNNWEATYFKFTKRKIKRLMKKASRLGVETFVLDDGWFSTRNSDKLGLGDWTCNRKKIPGGLSSLSKYANKLGMKFGIWMEPEMVNPDSSLFRLHSEWAIQDGVHSPSLGRNQLTLNLALKEVQDFVCDSVSNVLKSADISFLKWDYNRPMSDVKISNGESSFYYDYIVGLYSILKRLRKDFPNVLLENCASGGNRFDLGMLSYFAQSWMSDDTDSFERYRIQTSFSYGYPLSVMSNHVAAKVSHQLMRQTSLDTKFDVACFGILGYELDINDLSKAEKTLVKNQIAYYKKHRQLFQFGDSLLVSEFNQDEMSAFEVKNEKEAVVGHFRSVANISPLEGHLKALALDENKIYRYENRQEKISLNKFGGLVNMLLPFHLNPDGFLLNFVSRFKMMDGEIDKGQVSGHSLKMGAPILKDEWMGVGYNENVRLLGDFGARIYFIEEVS